MLPKEVLEIIDGNFGIIHLYQEQPIHNVTEVREVHID